MAIALARRYRPKRFTDLLVQDHVAHVLRGAVSRGRVGHGYLFSGPRGVGKTTAARILAMALNCPNRSADGDPCGECDSCRRIWGGNADLDVVEIDAASNRGVDDARDLRERAMYAASQAGHHKVYIVDEAHMLTREAWNALLKILEEPPPGVVFVFATTEPQKIAATAAPVLSRLQRFDFRRIGPAAIKDRLRAVLAEEQLVADDDALTLIARHADGGMRDALSVLDQCLSFGDEARVTATRVREILGVVDDEAYAELLRLVVAQDAAAAFALVDRLQAAGADLGEFLSGAADVLRALLMVQVGAEPEGLTEAVRELLQAYREQLAAGDVLRMLRLLAESETAVRRSANARLVVETLLLRWALLDRMVSLESVLSGAPAAAPAPAAPRVRAPVTAAPRQAPAAPPPRPSEARPAPAATADAAAEEQVAFTEEGLAAAWPRVLEAARGISQLLSTGLSDATIVEVAPPLVRITSADIGHRMLLESGRDRERLERLLGGMVGRPVKVEVVGGEPPARPGRLDDAALRADRLKVLRTKDPALDVAAAELDLEIVE